MSKITNRLMRKAGIILAGTAFGGVAGAVAANELVELFNIAEEAGNLLEVGLTGAGGLAGGWAAELREKATWSESPPSNPKIGDLWHNQIKNETFMWTGTDIGWLKANLA